MFAYLNRDSIERYIDGNMTSRITVLQNLPVDYWPVSDKMTAIERSYIGRPRAITTHVLTKLRIAFMIGCSEREACIFAGVHRMTLYRYQEQNPDFCDQKEAWKCWLIIQARKVISEAIQNDDVGMSWKYLQRKRSYEF